MAAKKSAKKATNSQRAGGGTRTKTTVSVQAPYTTGVTVLATIFTFLSLVFLGLVYYYYI